MNDDELFKLISKEFNGLLKEDPGEPLNPWDAFQVGFFKGMELVSQQAVEADACTCAKPNKQFMPSPKAYCGDCGLLIRTA